MKFLKSIFSSSKPKLDSPTKSSISSLAPKILTKKEDIEKIQPYLDKLKETINAEGVNNIALSGGYGSGKSTILKTFKNLNQNHEYLSVSLAAFNQKDGELDTPEKEKLERLIEVSILQQIFYHVAPEKIPESRFKRIINRKAWHFFLIAILFVLWVISMIMLLRYDYLDKLNPESWKRDLPFSWFGLFFIIVAFSGIGMLSKFALQLFSNSKINKVNIKGELELGEKATKSVFNEHLEEILYFFERTNYNVVIIEDLDRFDNTDIFTKLREINILLNNSNLIKREINFIYAVGDNLFKDKKERVKFFEYIIPVIPFINSSNAREQLQGLINEAGLKKDIFSPNFMSDVVTFIDDIDMRLLINIFHEFVIYRNTIKPEFVKRPEELFAIITYKNIEPEDFSLLNSRQGKLYTLINNKKKYIQKHIDQLDDKIKEKENKIKEIKKHSLEDERELRKIYIHHIIQNLPAQSILEQSIDSLLDDEGFQKVIDNKLTFSQFSHYYHNEYKISKNIDFVYNFSNIENEVNATLDYETRRSLIMDKENNQIKLLQVEILELKEQKINIESQDLHQIIQNIDLSDYLTDFSNNNLLRSLIINGYINENYNHYISLFHEGTVTRNDLIFDQNVRGGFNTEFTYKLDKIDGLLETLDSRYFTRESILNFDLVDHLAQNYDTRKPYYDTIIKLLCNKRERSIQFIDQYITDENRPISLFIKKLTKVWTHFFYYVAEESSYQEDKIYNYLRLILIHANLEDILNQKNDSLIEMIRYSPSFLSLVDTKDNKDLESKVSSILKTLDIKFNTLDTPTEETQRLFDFVYENDLYRINKENLMQMLERYSKSNDIEKFQTQNYSAIMNSECHKLIEYVNKNINDYVKSVYLGLEINTKEEEKYLIELYNKKNISTNSSLHISDKVETFISDVSQIHDDQLIFHMLDTRKLKANWQNLHYIYYGYEGTIEQIIEFINVFDNAKKLSSLGVPSTKDENGKMTFIQMWKDILASPTLSDESFENLLSASETEIKYFDFENTERERLERMIQNKSFALQTSVFDFLESDNNLGIKYLEEYKDRILQFDDTFEIDQEHFSLILKSEKFSINEINSILNNIDITFWNESSFMSNLRDRLSKSKNLEIESSKIIEVIEKSNSDTHNVQILINYFASFDRVELRKILCHLSDEEYQKYLSNDISKGIELKHNKMHDSLLELMIEHKYASKKSRRTKKGYIIYKNKDTISF